MGSQRTGHSWVTKHSTAHQKPWGIKSVSVFFTLSYCSRHLAWVWKWKWKSLHHIWLCNPMDCSTPGFPVHHHLPELAQTHVHWVSDAIQPSHPLSPPSLTLNLSQHQGLFQWVGSLHQVAKYWSFSFSISLPMNSQGWFPLGWTGLTSLQSKGFSRVFSNTTIWKHHWCYLLVFSLASPSLQLPKAPFPRGDIDGITRFPGVLDLKPEYHPWVTPRQLCGHISPILPSPSIISSVFSCCQTQTLIKSCQDPQGGVFDSSCCHSCT